MSHGEKKLFVDLELDQPVASGLFGHCPLPSHVLCLFAIALILLSA